MFAVQYIIGQLNNPILQWVNFIQNAQDAKISLERLNDIHQMDDEEVSEKSYITEIPNNKTILLQNVFFSYPANKTEFALKNISLTIPENKITAIVGASGSGKTTLLKLLLRIYNQNKGEIRVGSDEQTILNDNNVKLEQISHRVWRKSCGAVLQDGYIFNDSIASNIGFDENNIDYEKMKHSCDVACISEFIESTANGYSTKLGAGGVGISQGQKQRILIARAVYKNPDYLFFDEATNSLDSKNEKIITKNLEQFFKGKTVIVIAHRLSTVKNAHKIVVMDKGEVVEEGTHDYLTILKGKYYELVKNQLVIGN
jgi:ATP-binding cassette subfamily B protein